MALGPEQDFRNPLQTGVEEGGGLGLPWGPDPLPEPPKVKPDATKILPTADSLQPFLPTDGQPEKVSPNHRNGINHNGDTQEPRRYITRTLRREPGSGRYIVEVTIFVRHVPATVPAST